MHTRTSHARPTAHTQHTRDPAACHLVPSGPALRREVAGAHCTRPARSAPTPLATPPTSHKQPKTARPDTAGTATTSIPVCRGAWSPTCAGWWSRTACSEARLWLTVLQSDTHSDPCTSRRHMTQQCALPLYDVPRRSLPGAAGAAAAAASGRRCGCGPHSGRRGQPCFDSRGECPAVRLLPLQTRLHSAQHHSYMPHGSRLCADSSRVAFVRHKDGGSKGYSRPASVPSPRQGRPPLPACVEQLELPTCVSADVAGVAGCALQRLRALPSNHHCRRRLVSRSPLPSPSTQPSFAPLRATGPNLTTLAPPPHTPRPHARPPPPPALPPRQTPICAPGQSARA